MVNLLTETLNALKFNDKSEKDVIWVGCRNFKFSWEHYKTIANFEYDNGFGGNEISSDLVVVGDKWWLSRGEYDGSEWFDYNEKPKEPIAEINIKSLRPDLGVFGNDLMQINNLTELDIIKYSRESQINKLLKSNE